MKVKTVSNEQFQKLVMQEFLQTDETLARVLQNLEQIMIDMSVIKGDLTFIKGDLTLVKGITFTLNNRMTKLESAVENILLPKVKVLIDVVKEESPPCFTSFQEQSSS